MYFTTHFLEGYKGLNYTRYIFHAANFEPGMTAGTGFDSFDVMNSDKYAERENDLELYTIGSFNHNAGIRFNYYFNPHL